MISILPSIHVDLYRISLVIIITP